MRSTASSVTDLPENCTDDQLMRTFATRFNSIKIAKVQIDTRDPRESYGFVSFTDQDDQRDAMIQMNGFMGMGEQPLKVSKVTPKQKAEREIELKLVLKSSLMIITFMKRQEL